MSLVWERAPYTAGSLLVFLALADWANDDGVAWPSMERLAEKTRIDKRSAQRIVRQLQKDGMIQIEEGGGRAKQHRYFIQVERVANCHRLKDDASVTVSEIKGDISDTETVTIQAERVTSGTQTVTPMSPDPSEEPLDQPSVDPSEPPFCSPDFCSALKDFEQHRKEKRIKVTPTARRLMFKKFATWGEERSTAALVYSTEKNYTGCFEETNGNGSSQPRYEPASQRSARNLRENTAYIRELSNASGEVDREDPIGLLTTGI